MSYLSATEINKFMKQNQQYFESSQISLFKNMIAESNLTWEELNTFRFKSPNLGRMLSVLLGGFGIDRFYAGNYGLGALKLFTLGAYGIWWIVDWFLIGNAVKKENQIKFSRFLTETEMNSEQKWTTYTNVAKRVWNSPEARESIKDFLKAGKEVRDTMDPDNR